MRYKVHGHDNMIIQYIYLKLYYPTNIIILLKIKKYAE